MPKIRIVHNVEGMTSVNVYYVSGHCCDSNYVEERERKKKRVLLAGNLSYREVTNYLEIPEHKCELVFDATSSGTQIVKAKGTFSSDRNYTVILAGSPTNPNHVLVYEDRTKCARPGTASVRFIVATVSATSFYDVYLNRTLVFSNVNFPNTGDPVYASQPLGQTTVRVVPHNMPMTSMTASTTNITLISGGIYTMMTTGTGSQLIVIHDNPQRCRYTCDIVQRNFELQRFTGAWYLACGHSSKTPSQQMRKTMLVFTLLSDRVKMTTVEYDNNWNQISSTSTSIVPVNWCDPVAFTMSSDQTTMIVHATDYDHYAIVGTTTRAMLWLLSRKKCVDTSKCREMIDTARKLGYTVNLF